MRISPLPVGTDALGSHTRSATTYLYTYKYNAPLTSGTKDLQVRVYTGNNWGTEARPCILYMSTLAWTTTNTADTALVQQLADYFVTSGIIFMNAESRVNADSPRNPDDGSLGIVNDAEARNVVAVIDDCKHLWQWVTGVHQADTWHIEPNWTFPAGASCGAISWMLACRKYSWLREQIPGMILSCAAYTVDSLPLYETAIRTTLGYTEAGHDSTMPPIRAQLGGGDTSLGVSGVAAFKSLLDGLGSPNVVDYNPTGGHDTLLTFDTNYLTAATTIAEAMKDFVDTRTGAVARESSTPQFG